MKAVLAALVFWLTVSLLITFAVYKLVLWVVGGIALGVSG